MKDLVTVVLPTFNRPDSLKKALESVLFQHHKNFEVLVVNDSNDEQPVLMILDQLKDSRLKYLRNQRKKGANGARNTGILAANGKYIAFLDDDDEWLPNKLQWQLEYLENNEGTCGVFSAYRIEKKWGWRTYIPAIGDLTLTQVLLNSVSVGSSSNLLFHSELFKRVGLWDEELKRQQDLELLARITCNEKIGFDNRVALKVLGHHDLQAEKAIEGHEEYYSKVLKWLSLIDGNAQNRFHSNHYRRLAMYRIRLKDYKEAYRLYQKALLYEILHPRKDIKNIILLFGGLFTHK